jgi:hypothetical protein
VELGKRMKNDGSEQENRILTRATSSSNNEGKYSSICQGCDMSRGRTWGKSRPGRMLRDHEHRSYRTRISQDQERNNINLRHLPEANRTLIW